MRTAARLASGLNAPWLVISIERADSPPPRPEVTQRLAATFKLAESLGAETRRVTGQDFVEEILKTARREHVTQIVIGGRRQTFLASLLRKSLPDALIERVSGLGIHVVTSEEPGPPARRRSGPCGDGFSSSSPNGRSACRSRPSPSQAIWDT